MKFLIDYSLTYAPLLQVFGLAMHKDLFSSSVSFDYSFGYNITLFESDPLIVLSRMYTV